MNDQSLYLLTEASGRTGLTVEALRQRIKRGKLEAVKGNEGLLRVRLTTADLEAIDRTLTGHGIHTAASQPVNDDRLLKALEEAAEARGEATELRTRAEMAEARADRAEAAVVIIPELRERAGRAEGESVALREQVTAERERAEAARAELAEWTAGGPLARAWRAFLNRRGA
jgi:hypothetical protein